MTELDLDAIEARNETAHKHIDDLCHGHKRWTMRIPARPDEDSDLVLSRSLNDVPALVAEVRRLRATRQRVQELVDRADRGVGFSGMVGTANLRRALDEEAPDA